MHTPSQTPRATARPALRLLERSRAPVAAAGPPQRTAARVAWWERLFFGVGDTARR